MKPTPPKTYAFPQYLPSERIADLGCHVAGLALAAVAVPVLLTVGLDGADAVGAFGLALYVAGLVAMLAFSASYNIVRRPGPKEILRRFDRAAIYLMIAGTYSPFALAMATDARGPALLALVWGLAVLGVVLTFTLPRRGDRFALVLYLAMGWSIVMAIDPLLDTVPGHVVTLLLTGGIIYTVGVIVHLARGLLFHNALWHACVLVAAAFHYFAVLDTVSAAP